MGEVTVEGVSLRPDPRAAKRARLEAELAVRRGRRLGTLPRSEPLARQIAEHLGARADAEQLAVLRAAARRSVIDELPDIIEPAIIEPATIEPSAPTREASRRDLPDLPELPELPER